MLKQGGCQRFHKPCPCAPPKRHNSRLEDLFVRSTSFQHHVSATSPEIPVQRLLAVVRLRRAPMSAQVSRLLRSYRREVKGGMDGRYSRQRVLGPMHHCFLMSLGVGNIGREEVLEIEMIKSTNPTLPLKDLFSEIERQSYPGQSFGIHSSG